METMDIESLEKLTRSFMDSAKKNKLADGDVIPIVAVIDKTGQTSIIGLEITGTESKKRAYQMVREFMKQRGAIAAISVNDAWYYSASKDPGDKIDLATATPPSEHPDRKEALMVNLTTVLGHRLHLMQPYHMDGKEIIWEEPTEMRPDGVTSSMTDNLLGSLTSDTLGGTQ
jgi:hypothetical protein